MPGRDGAKAKFGECDIECSIDWDDYGYGYGYVE